MVQPVDAFDLEMLGLAGAPDDLPDIIVNVADLAGVLQLHPRTIQRWLLAEKLHGHRMGAIRSRWRVRTHDVARLSGLAAVRGDRRMKKHLLRAAIRGGQPADDGSAGLTCLGTTERTTKSA